MNVNIKGDDDAARRYCGTDVEDTVLSRPSLSV
jgi:hypothetical protein